MNFIAVLDSFDGEDLLEVVFLAFVEGLHLDLHLEEVKLFPLGLAEVVEEFYVDGELFEGGGEDGVLAEVDLVFV